MARTLSSCQGRAFERAVSPHDRSDVADYVGMSLEAVSRSLRTLTSRGVISFRDKRNLKIVDRAQLELTAQADLRGKHRSRAERG
ncbi:MAG: helix-turn-helix domain-containing protein [Stellaceae bacterium]